jgi:membrane protein YqaA with SNARE-associated domain
MASDRERVRPLSTFFLVDWATGVLGVFSGNPLLLVFVLGLLGNIIPFVPTPSLALVVALVVSPGSPFQGVGLVEIASITALGACIGKLVSYVLGYGARRAIGKPERLDSLRKFLGGSTFLVGLVFAASPLVDTAFIPLGMIRYSLPKTLVSLYTGKFIWILSVLFFARQLGESITQVVGEGTYASIFSVALLVPIAYFLLGVDWENRLLGRTDTLRNRIISRIRGFFTRENRPRPSSETVSSP